MDTVAKKTSALPLFSMGIGLLLLLGAVFVQFAGSNAVHADISDLFSRDKKELFQALLTSGNTPGRLLRSNRQSIAEIAETLGFSSAQYFSYKFVKVVGIPPSKYIKK